MGNELIINAHTQRYCVQCGNMIYAEDSDGNAVCPICGGMKFDTKELLDTDIVKCAMCGKKRTVGELYKSGWGTIPFFNKEEMSYYCGCMGWD